MSADRDGGTADQMNLPVAALQEVAHVLGPIGGIPVDVARNEAIRSPIDAVVIR